MDQIVLQYYADNARKLRKLVDRILSEFGGLADKDFDDFYSLANEVFVDVMKRYDESQSFHAFLFSCLSNRIKTEMTKRNCEKRRADRMSVSIDSPLGEDEDLTIGDVIASDYNMEKEVVGEENDRMVRLEQYLDRLSGRQRRILFLLADSYGAGEIKNMLQISQKEYADAMDGIQSYENVSILF
mgnify:FL=1|jgi:RNA polymerase sigma factor, sigma-70 family